MTLATCSVEGATELAKLDMNLLSGVKQPWFVKVCISSYFPCCNFCLPFAAVDCGPLIAPTNGTVILTNTTFGSTVTYSCDTGYTLNGGSTRTCQSGRTWSGAAPTCGGKRNCTSCQYNS